MSRGPGCRSTFARWPLICVAYSTPVNPNAAGMMLKVFNARDQRASGLIAGLAVLALMQLALAQGVIAQPLAASRVREMAAVPSVAGTYVVRRVNERPLPYSDRLPTSDGFEHRATLVGAFLRLDSAGTFSLFVRYKHAHQLRRAPMEFAPQLDTELNGRWTLERSTLTLAPDNSRRRRPHPPVVARLDAGRVTLPYLLDTGWTLRRYVMVAQYDPTYF